MIFPNVSTSFYHNSYLDLTLQSLPNRTMWIFESRSTMSGSIMKPNTLQVKSEVNPGLTEVSERAAADFTETTAALPTFHLYLPRRGNETVTILYKYYFLIFRLCSWIPSSVLTPVNEVRARSVSGLALHLGRKCRASCLQSWITVSKQRYHSQKLHWSV